MNKDSDKLVSSYSDDTKFDWLIYKIPKPFDEEKYKILRQEILKRQNVE